VPRSNFKLPRGAVWRTLRFRLAAWNAAVVIITALVTLIGLRQGVRWALVHELDQVLIDDVHEIALVIRSTAGDSAALKAGLTRMAEGHERRGWHVTLLGEDETPVWSSPDAPPETLPLASSRDLSPVSLGGYRVAQQRVAKAVDGIQFIRVGATLDHIREDMARIDRWVLLAAGAVLLAAPLCGYWLASRAARTIGDIITTASKLRPIRLGERLTIRGSGDELDLLAQTINGLLDRIAAYVDTKRDFLANAAHELRTPLAAIRSSVEVALNGSRSPEEYEDLMVDVIDECSALETLVNQLLLLSETEADLPTARMEPVDLSKLASKSVDMFTGVADARGIKLQAGSLAPATVLGNPAHLRQVLNNLIDNAVKYTPLGGHVVVDVAVDAEEGQVELRVSDSGPGISPVEQQHIFERFYRAESSRYRSPGVGGTGLGLSICQSVVHNHGGEIRFVSELGHGTTFTVRLPLAANAPAVDAAAVSAL
jgi:signal transduction histidine kinase